MENDIIAHIYWIRERPRLERPRTQFNRGERESTQPLETWNVSALDYLPYLEITFNDIPRTNRGFLFGYNPYCDVVLPNQGISGTHFSLTFDNSNRLIVKDLNSLRATEVTYDGNGKSARSGFQWIVGGHDILQDKRRVAIAVPDIISFQIFVPLTRPLTGTQTPGTGEIYLRKKLGKGTFSTVTHLWNPHIVQLIASSFTPRPKLYLEYIPGGSLEAHEDISYNETLSLIRQCLSALTYLHESEPPVAHRDIKPANILVQHRYDDDIFVKLGDFGISRDRAELETFCGTLRYQAPEIWLGPGYTPIVDIWSLGVVACELIYGLPFSGHKIRSVAWCKSIVIGLRQSQQETPNDFGRFLLNAMVVLSPDSRFSARDCYDLVLDLPWSQATDQMTSRYIVQDHDIGGSEYARTITPSYFTSSGTLDSSSSFSQQQEVPSPLMITEYNNPRQRHEMSQFRDCSEHLFNPLYVGSSLASQLGENDSWASQFQHGSAQWEAGAAGSQTGSHHELAKSSVSPGQREGQGSVCPEESNAICEDDYEEQALAAMLLQAIAQS
ncbi:hypothetical protein FOC1_g10001135 [Fusarium oxysporum f. sp. cubense race 1]|uniref:non-specific serine/threonine protein kinase n=1 Tax=Fusarium oxysporum f. sp. cubense (strain race 1) TaxID=1229664 RepID=N4TR06_FUSC1|nr:hypothetical protein FOC1_g10001135 [Fusarium oxysporum f. sp. cubense race 1]